MRIEIITDDGNELTYFELDSNPFKIGESINLQVTNHDKSIWDIQDIKGDYTITKIEHILRKDYTKLKMLNEVNVVLVHVKNTK